MTLVYLCISALLATASCSAGINNKSTSVKGIIPKISSGPIPVVMWHGINSKSSDLDPHKALIEQEIPGIFVLSVKTAKTGPVEVEESFFGSTNNQVKAVCDQLQQNPVFKNGYNGIGFSQGSQLMRGLAEQCSDPPMLSFITIGGQHQGVYSFPGCPGENKTLCDILRKMLNYGIYSYFVQRLVIPAQYWHDSDNEFEYQHKSIFLSDINNVLEINPVYKQNIMRLRNFVMLKFTQDKTVDPVESSWFGFYKPGQDKEIMTLQESQLYLEDRLGLKKLDEEGKLKFLSIVADHMQMPLEWFNENIIQKYLK